MQLGRAAKSAILALSLLWCVAGTSQSAMTTREWEALPPNAANKKVHQDLLSVLAPIGPITPGYRKQLHSVSLMTRAFGTDIDGVCRRDIIILSYAPTIKRQTGEDAPVRPYGVGVYSLYAVTKRFLKEHEDDLPVIWQSDCASAGEGPNGNWISAMDARTAGRGFSFLEAATKAIRAGSLKPEPCSALFQDGKMTCEQAILANASPSKISGVIGCGSLRDILCYVINVRAGSGISQLTIKARVAEDAINPTAITSIAIEQHMVVS